MTDFHFQYKQALHYAAAKHKDQLYPGTKLPYIVHAVTVAMEVTEAAFHTSDFDREFAIVMALLHDTIEDTTASYQEVADLFGPRVADGVLALTKFDSLEKELRMEDSINRIMFLEREVWAVKIADRISNLDAPPLDWKKEKRLKYRDGALNILHKLGAANEFLARRLETKIEEYQRYVDDGAPE